MIRGLVTRGRDDGADPAVHRVFSEFWRLGFGRPSEVPVHGLAHERGQARAAPGGLVPQLPIGFFREPQVRCHISHHRDTTVSQNAYPVNRAEPNRLRK
jgi:hypothetical protein